MTPTHSLQLFGGLSLRNAAGPVAGRASQRRRLALLAVLAAERRPVTRDKLLGLFWSEMDDERARHLLADSLYVLRSTLGEDSIVTTGDDVAVNEDRLESDVGAFLEAIERGEPARAADLYTGPFLDGIFVSDAPEFERWAETARTRLAAEYRRSLERLAVEAGERGDDRDAVESWRRLAAADPVSSRAALGLMRALARSGDRAAALQFARIHEDIVRAELDVPPDPAVTALVGQLRSVSPKPPSAVINQDIGTEAARSVLDHPASTAATVADDTKPSTVRWQRSQRTVAGIATITILALTAIMAVRARRSHDTAARESAIAAGRSTPDSRSPLIVVLPFDSVASDQDVAYLVEGITDAVMGALDRLRTLRVVSRTSAAAVKQMGLSATAIGDSLRARYLVEGTVGQVGRDVHVAARLTDTRTGTRLWSREFSAPFSAVGITSVEDSIARSVADALSMNHGAGAPSVHIAGSPPSTEVYFSYLTGRHLWESRNPADVQRSIGHFNDAIAKDSTFALAYAGLADSYASLGIGNMRDFRATDYFPRARAAAEHALALDSTLAEAHATLGYVHVLYDFDWDGASRELARAIDLRPSYSTARIYRAILFEWTGHFELALREAQDAAALDPVSPLSSNLELGRALFLSQMYDSAAVVFRATLARDPTSLRGHMHLGQVYVQQRRFDDAIRELTRAARLSPNTSRPVALLAHAYGAKGDVAAAHALLDTVRQRARRGYVPAFDFAIVHAGLGNRDEMFAALDSAFADHSIRPYLMDPTFAPFRGDARYRTLLDRLDLPWPKPH